MAVLLTMMVGLVLTGQEGGQPAGPAATLPAVEVSAPVNQGVVVLECRISRDGGPEDCVILSETPAGQGFGEAALASAHRSRLSRRDVQGAGPDGTVRFTVRFRLAD